MHDTTHTISDALNSTAAEAAQRLTVDEYRQLYRAAVDREWGVGNPAIGWKGNRAQRRAAVKKTRVQKRTIGQRGGRGR